MLYLLGELPGDQAAQWERRLQASPELGEELLRQADLIAALSLVRSEPALPRVTRGSMLRWPIVASIVAVAACIVMIVLIEPLGTREREGFAGLGAFPTNDSGTSEDLLIARAWADSQLHVATDDYLEFEVDDAVAISADDPSDVDTTLSWMFTAVSASIDAHSSEATNDG